MINSMSTKILAVMVLGALLLTGCGREDKEEKAELLAESADVLKYIPADSPYVFASLAPLPDDVMDHLEPKLDRVLVSYQAVLREVVAVCGRGHQRVSQAKSRGGEGRREQVSQALPLTS